MSQIHARVSQRLELLGPGPAAFYRDAYLVLEEVRAGRLVLPTATHIVGHLLRELEGAVRAVLYAQLVEPPPSVTAEPPSEVSPEREVRRGASGAAPPQAGSFSSPLGLPGESPSLDSSCPQRKGPSHRDQIKAILGALGFSDDGPESREWLRIGPGDTALHGVAHRNALNAPRELDEVFIATFDAMTQLLDAVLDRFAARYAAVYDQLDALLALETPTTGDVRRLYQELPNTPITLGYFFDRLVHPGWLGPLEARGFFSAPPPPVVDADQGTGGYAHWFAADYLLRMAPLRPAEVAAILAKVPSTENIRVQGQLIDVMIALRPVDRVVMAPLVEAWVAEFGRRFWGDHAPRFVLALLSDGEVELALSLAERLLELPLDWRSGMAPRAAEFGRVRERAWHLREAAESLFPALCRAAPVRTIEMLAAALDVHAGRRAADADADAIVDQTAGLVDYSEYWAEGLGDSEQHEAADLRVLLTYMLHRALQQTGAEAPALLGEAVAVIRKHGARVLRRVELSTLVDLLRSDDEAVRQAALPLALERLCSTAVLAESSLNAKVGSLLRAAFPHAAAAERLRVLDALVAPPFDWLAEEHVPGRRARWRRDRLALIEEHLPLRERGELLALTKSEGAPEYLEVPAARFSSGFVGIPSPLDEAELRAMTLGELLGFLAVWQPREGSDEPSREGLAVAITVVATADPAAYAGWAPAFIGHHPVYVAALLRGFRMAARADKRIPWQEVLTLMEWAVNQQVSADDMLEVDSAERLWRDVRREAADLARLALGAVGIREHAALFEEHDRIWKIVSILAEDANPSPAYEERWSGTNGDPANLAINTVRPQAVDAAIRFAYWSAGHRGDGDALPKGVLTQEPAVAALLERHLNPSIDSSVAVRAVIGQWVPWLARTDAPWVTDHQAMLFPQASEYAALHDALWRAYVVWTRPHSDVVAVLAPEYRAAIDRMGRRAGDDADRTKGEERADEHLAEHLVTLYWLGALTVDDPDGLIAQFFARADGSCRAHALEYVGRSLLNTEGPVDPAVLERLRVLWEWRARAFAPRVGDDGAPKTDVPSKRSTMTVADARQEAMQFGLWFASGAFPPDWALTQLEEALRAAGNVEWSCQVAERLTEVAKQEPARAAACLLSVDFARSAERWMHERWLNHLAAILAPALASADPAVVGVAHEVVNRVVAAGYTEHRALLRPSSEQQPPPAEE